ncbi:hypothetical protein M378DRAFT_17271 [Amanita muscaria Koide BX008]|uniref:Uncharacterized protein n=1 Tax=Amanita muscaria (strain Koide BX008) TaxID=946122 RepID=A0A0C2WJA5_AMAMK|nr:hypothetical protein M378DRAFT_17271 [Amanita muscaria Koide BX008]
MAQLKTKESHRKRDAGKKLSELKKSIENKQHHKRLAPPSLYAHNHPNPEIDPVLKLLDQSKSVRSKAVKNQLSPWNAFCDQIAAEGGDGKLPLHAVEGAAPPSLVFLKTFAYYLGTTTLGMIDPSGCASLNTIKNELQLLKSTWVRRTGSRIPPDNIQQMRAYLCSEEYGNECKLVTAMRPKPIAISRDLLLLSRRVWTDNGTLWHNCERVQLMCLTVLGFVTSAQLGELLLSSAYKGTLQCLQYQHLTFLVNQGTIVCTLNNTFMKGYRENDAVFRGSPLTVDLEHPTICPIALLLSLALMDGVFKDATTWQDIFQLVSDATDGCCQQLAIRDNQKQLPVFRAIKRVDGVWTVTTEPLGYYRYWEMLCHYGLLAGFPEPLTHYAWRRGLGNVLDKNVGISAARWKGVMGHTEHSNEYVSLPPAFSTPPPCLALHAPQSWTYQSKMLMVDLVAIAHERDEDRQLITDIVSMSALVDDSAPTELTHIERATIWEGGGELMLCPPERKAVFWKECQKVLQEKWRNFFDNRGGQVIRGQVSAVICTIKDKAGSLSVFSCFDDCNGSEADPTWYGVASPPAHLSSWLQWPLSICGAQHFLTRPKPGHLSLSS